MPPGDFSNMFDFPAINMAAAHNMFIQGINAMVYHAPHITPEQVLPFMLFCQATFSNIHHHHDIEEEYYFGALENKLGKGVLTPNTDEHKLFVPKLGEFENYLKDITSGKEKYDGNLIIERIHSFSDTMIMHLNHEIPTISSSRLKEHFTEKELHDIDKKFMELAFANIDFYIALPIAVGCANPATPWFPPFPLPLRWATRLWFSRKHRKSWEFCPLDLSGKPRPWYNEAAGITETSTASK
ncbi:hypothetical protein BDV98DRAFT_590830 [Pterulicium gracile]|uniref:Hemerythrin-like domain-containing protein n=1 Tax=Pterulicium gracile TaxID=1884261 RepID=A0A5C3QZZ2_9AGAR|nr:hypothetical protein BDV98DRAFT_590830 [Pterula gracilis]